MSTIPSMVEAATPPQKALSPLTASSTTPTPPSSQQSPLLQASPLNENFMNDRVPVEESPSPALSQQNDFSPFDQQNETNFDLLILPSGHPLSFHLQQHPDTSPHVHPPPVVQSEKRNMEQTLMSNFSSFGEKAKHRMKHLTSQLVSARKMDSATHRKAEMEKKRRGGSLPRPVKFLEPYIIMEEQDGLDALWDGPGTNHLALGTNQRISSKKRSSTSSFGSNKRRSITADASPRHRNHSSASPRKSLTLDQVINLVVTPLMQQNNPHSTNKERHTPLKTKFICRPLPGIVSHTPPSPGGAHSSLLQNAGISSTLTGGSSPSSSMASESGDSSNNFPPVSSFAANPSTPSSPAFDFPEFMTITRNRSTSVTNVRDNNVKRFLYKAFTERENQTAPQREKEMEEKMKAELRKAWHETSRNLDMREKEIEKELRKRREALARKVVKS